MIGNFREQIDLLQPSFVEDGGGGADLSWSSYRNVRASVKNLRSISRTIAGAQFIMKRIECILRYDAAFDRGWRIGYLGVQWMPYSIEIQEDTKRTLRLLCEEIT